MTTLANLVSDVMTITNRPDLVEETKLAVRAATLKAHQSDYFYKDIFEEGIIFVTKEILQTFEVKTLIPRFRAFKYLRKCDLDNNGNPVPMAFLELLTPTETLDDYGCMKENICYMAGLELKIRSCAAWDKFLFGCYMHPSVIEADYASWIADDFPLAIIYRAAGDVFKAIGNDEKKATYQQMALEEIAALKLSNIIAAGY